MTGHPLGDPLHALCPWTENLDLNYLWDSPARTPHVRNTQQVSLTHDFIKMAKKGNWDWVIPTMKWELCTICYTVNLNTFLCPTSHKRQHSSGSSGIDFHILFTKDSSISRCLYLVPFRSFFLSLPQCLCICHHPSNLCPLPFKFWTRLCWWSTEPAVCSPRSFIFPWTQRKTHFPTSWAVGTSHQAVASGIQAEAMDVTAMYSQYLIVTQVRNSLVLCNWGRFVGGLGQHPEQTLPYIKVGNTSSEEFLVSLSSK